MTGVLHTRPSKAGEIIDFFKGYFPANLNVSLLRGKGLDGSSFG